MNTKAALLVIDVQNIYLTIRPPELTSDGDDLLAKVSDLIDRARAAQIPVIYIQHVGFGTEGLSDEELAIHPCIAPRKGELIIQKKERSAFEQTRLGQELTSREVSALIVCGLATWCCVDATCRHACNLGYRVIIVKDAHACRDTSERTAAETIAQYNAEWHKLGIELIRVEAIDLAKKRTD